MENSFYNIAILGANGTIGKAYLSHFSELDNVKTIYAFSRSKVSSKSAKVIPYKINYNNEEEIKASAMISSKIRKLDLVIVANGILYDNQAFPEKKISEISIDNLKKLFFVNTILPLIFAKHFLPQLSNENTSVFAFMSARIGSISDNRLGGWYSYRASKASLNMMIKNLSIEIERTNKKAVIVGLHPGTVDSPLSKPFQKNIPKNKLFSPEFSIRQLSKVIYSLKPEDSGKIYAWDGVEINP